MSNHQLTTVFYTSGSIPDLVIEKPLKEIKKHTQGRFFVLWPGCTTKIIRGKMAILKIITHVVCLNFSALKRSFLIGSLSGLNFPVPCFVFVNYSENDNDLHKTVPHGELLLVTVLKFNAIFCLA